MKSYAVLLILLTFEDVASQNLVRNPSFEDADVPCGYVKNAEDFNKRVNFWTTPSRSRPEIYSNNSDESCVNYYSANASVAPRDGANSIGFCLAAPDSQYRTYLQVSLINTLKKGRTYHFDFWVCPLSWSKFASNQISIHLSEQEVKVDSFHELYYDQDFVEPKTVSDTLSWTQIKGKFKARINAKYLIIGNFSSVENTRLEVIRDHIEDDFLSAFYFIDDVYLGNIPRPH